MSFMRIAKKQPVVDNVLNKSFSMSKQDDKRQINVTFDYGTVARAIALVAVAGLAVVFLSKIIQPLVLILISFFLALALNPAVSWIARHLKSKSRVRATGVAYLVVIGFLIGFFSFVFPPLVKQTVDFIKEIPSTIQDVKNQNNAVSSFIYKYNIDEEIDQLTSDFGSRFEDISKPALATAGKIGTTLVGIVTVLVLTFMMLVEGPVWLERYFTNLKNKHRSHHKKLASRMYKVVVSYVNGQVVIAVLGGIFASITLFIASQVLNVSINAVALGGIIALFALLPLIGTIIGSIIVVLSCLLVSIPLAIVMAIYFVIYQQIENVTIQPYIQSRGSSLTPLIVFVSALLGIGLGGILGAILAIPAAGCIKVIIDDYFERKNDAKTHA